MSAIQSDSKQRPFETLNEPHSFVQNRKTANKASFPFCVFRAEMGPIIQQLITLLAGNQIIGICRPNLWCWITICSTFRSRL